jgi:hypothetical protein
MKTIVKIIAKNMELQLVEVQIVEKADWKHQPDYVRNSYEIQRNGETVAFGGIVGLQETYKHMCNVASNRKG